MRKLIALAAILGLSVVAEHNAAHATGPLGNGAGENWPFHNADSDETAFSRLGKIDRGNVGHLGLAWSFDLPGEVTLEATPLAVNGVLYFTGSYATVYAVDGVSGKLLWKFAPKTWQYNPLKMIYGFAANRGAAYANGRIFSAALDGRLFALDAKTGKVLWTALTTPAQSMQTITGVPRVFDGMVIIGNAGADLGARGYVTAYDANSGRQMWRFYAVPGSPAQNKGDPAMERAAKTWTGEFWKMGGGGGSWDCITFDRELNRIYIGTANPSPYDPQVRSPGGGDNLYTDSIVALDARTGTYIWHYQVNPLDAWDYDSTQQMTLADLVIDGKKRHVLMQAPKNGFLYVLDRVTGKLISAGKIGKVTWADHIDLTTGRPVEQKDIRYQSGETTIWPSPAGAHSWQSMSYDPKTGLVYIPYMQLGVHFMKGKTEPGAVDVGGVSIKGYEAGPLDGKGALVAWDPIRQQQAWRVQYDTIWNGGVLSTAGHLVFQGDAGGHFSAFDAITGQRLWQSYAEDGIIGAPISYAVKGRQYVSVLAGYGGSAAIWSSVMNVGWKFTAPRRLLTFALDGRAALPPAPPPDMHVQAVDNPSLKLDPKDVVAGHAMYMACASCHGRDAVGAGGPAPDLRESQIALDPNALWTVVHDGALMQQGMPRFDMLPRNVVMQIYTYIRARARETVQTQNNGQGH